MASKKNKSGGPATSPEPTVRRVTLWLCDLCLNGAGGQCHVPGCILFLNRAPDLPLHPELYEVAGEVVEALRLAEEALAGATEDALGGFPDLFGPQDGWDAWWASVAEALAAIRAVRSAKSAGP